MSFNGTFGNQAGFTLPSFTNVQPTVSVSGVVTGAENISQPSSQDSKANSGPPDRNLIELNENEQSNNDKIDSNPENDKLDNSAHHQDKINHHETSIAGSAMESILHDNDIRKNSSTDTYKESATTLESILAGNKKKTSVLSNIENEGKGQLLDEESSGESSAEEENDSFSEDKPIEGFILVKESVKSECKGEEDEEEDDDADDDDEASITNEKRAFSDTKSDEEETRQISHDEALINETLEKSTPEPLIPFPQSEIGEKTSVTSSIDKEVENEVNKIQTSLTHTKTNSNNDRATEPEETDPVRLRRLTRHNSIKDIPNPPSNLQRQQAFDFQTFLAQFKSKDCQHAHKYLKSFLDQFNQRIWTVEEQVKLLHEFEEFLFQKLIQFKPFNEMGNDETKINNCKEGLEKLVMTKVYTSVFSPAMSFIKLTETHKHDKLMDKKYLMNTYLYDWVELKHLDLDLSVKVDSNFIKLASEELCKIDNYKSPRDKIVCILNSSKIIFGLIRQQEDTPENADSFVPLLIYVLLHSNFKHLYSNLQYIERFRNQEFLIGETSYYVSTLQIACNFIINISKDQLTIGDEEYENKMKEARIKVKELQHSSYEESPSQVLTKSAEMVKQSLSNSFNSFIQNITSDDLDEGAANPATNEGDVRTGVNNSARERHGHRRDLEVSADELERIRQLSLEENKAMEQKRSMRKEVVQQLANMFPDLDRGLIEDVLMGFVNDEGSYNVSECVTTLLALNE